MRLVEAPLVGPGHPAFGERGVSVHAGEHDVRGLPAALDVDRLVGVTVSDGWRVARPRVGDESGSLLDVLGDEPLERNR